MPIDLRSSLSLALIALGVVVVGLVVWLVARRRQASTERNAQPIPLFFPPDDDSRPIARPTRPGEGWRSTRATPPHTDPLMPAVERDAGAPTWDRPPAPAASSNGRPSPPPRVAPNLEGETVEGHGVRYFRPGDGTLQFLPGRLEVIDGRDDGHEIRFVRGFGVEGSQVTFGRSEGEPYRHVQLREQTVSRNHARMSLEQGAWRLTNLSRTNPVVVNGEALPPDDGTVVLVDGDRIEMGEVVFRFRER